MKIIENIKGYAYHRRHFYRLNHVVAEGVCYNVMSVTPIHNEEKTKKAKEILKYLIAGK